MAANRQPYNANAARNGAPRKRAVPPAEKNARKKLGQQRPPLQQAPPVKRGLLDVDAKNTIAAILCILAAVALMLVVVWPTDALVASFLSLALRRGLGLGAYILPVLLAVIGATFVMRFNSERVPIRVIVGVGLMFFGLLILLALFTPEPLAQLNGRPALFADSEVVVRGGFVGAGPAYAGLVLLGLPVSVIVAMGIIAVGLVVIGFSLRKVVKAVQKKRAQIEARRDDELSVAPDIPFEPVAPDMQALPARAVASVDPTANTVAIGTQDDAALEAEAKPREKPQPASPAKNSGRISPRQSATQPLTRKLGAKQRKPNNEDAKAQPAKKVALQEAAQQVPGDDFVLPDAKLLKVSPAKRANKALEEELDSTAAHLQQTMEDFGIGATVVDWVAGPTVTLFEVDLPPGVRVSRLIALNNDIALALAAPGVRIFAPIPGTHFVGIEVPNATRENVLLGDILKDVSGGPLEVAIGKDVEGNPIIEDLAKMPHLLIGGTTGSGKSVGINAMIMSILMRATPSQVRFIMIDPKRVEFAPYDGIPHLYAPVVTEPKEAASALSWGVAEMELRLKTFQKAGVRNIGTYNAQVASGKLRKQIDDGEISAQGFPQPQYIDTPMPYIVIVIDELADLMMNVGKEVEFSISRIAQLARAAGIHLIVATQRPSANVVTGLIKANITTRIAYNVASGLDSRVILDTAGAESLIGLGDLLLAKPEFGKPLRVQGCYTSDGEIEAVVAAVKAQGEPDYHSEVLKTNLITLGDSAPDGSGGSGGNDDPLIWEAAEIVVSSGMGSTSNIQRKLKVGYSRAGRIMDMLEEKGVVGPPNGSKPRDVLVDAMELETLKAFEQADGQE